MKNSNSCNNNTRNNLAVLDTTSQISFEEVMYLYFIYNCIVMYNSIIRFFKYSLLGKQADEQFDGKRSSATGLLQPQMSCL